MAYRSHHAEYAALPLFVKDRLVHLDFERAEAPRSTHVVNPSHWGLLSGVSVAYATCPFNRDRAVDEMATRP